MPYKHTFELADSITTNPDISGASWTSYTLSPAVWLKEIVDAAQKQFYAIQFAYQTELKDGQKDVVIPMRMHKMYSGATTWEIKAAEGAAVSYTTMNNLCGVTLSPTDWNAGIAISNRAIRTNAVDLIRNAREALTDFCGNEVDVAMFDALKVDTYKATSSIKGSQAIYGGDATQASGIAAGDVITTDMVAEAKRKLQTTNSSYWTYGTGETQSAVYKNPWANEKGTPFVMFIGPEQEETFLTDGQFVNAAQYGSDKIIHNGEIGEYLGIKIVVSSNTPFYAASATHPDSSTTAVAQHRCMMIKAQKAGAIAWGLKPRLQVVDYPSELEKRLIIEQAYQCKQLHSDAIVHINVADK